MKKLKAQINTKSFLTSLCDFVVRLDSQSAWLYLPFTASLDTQVRGVRHVVLLGDLVYYKFA